MRPLLKLRNLLVHPEDKMSTEETTECVYVFHVKTVIKFTRVRLEGGSVRGWVNTERRLRQHAVGLRHIQEVGNCKAQQNITSQQ